MTSANDSISRIFAVIKKNTPMGESLIEVNFVIQVLVKHRVESHQMTHRVMIIMASLKATKKS